MLEPGARGARKHVVTNLYEAKEVEATHSLWRPPEKGELCQVVVAENWEMATFNEVADQDRHYHARGTEIYIVLDGGMWIKVGDDLHHLGIGDTIIVNPGTVHEVIRKDGEDFLARVITMDCGGPDDKFVVE